MTDSSRPSIEVENNVSVDSLSTDGLFEQKNTISLASIIASASDNKASRIHQIAEETISTLEQKNEILGAYERLDSTQATHRENVRRLEDFITRHHLPEDAQVVAHLILEQAKNEKLTFSGYVDFTSAPNSSKALSDKTSSKSI